MFYKITLRLKPISSYKALLPTSFLEKELPREDVTNTPRTEIRKDFLTVSDL